MITGSRKNVSQEPICFLTLAFRIFADKMITPGAATIQRYQIEAGDWLRICITVRAKNPLTFAANLERYKVVCPSCFAAIERDHRPLKRNRIEMA